MMCPDTAQRMVDHHLVEFTTWTDVQLAQKLSDTAHLLGKTVQDAVGTFASVTGKVSTPAAGVNGQVLAKSGATVAWADVIGTTVIDNNDGSFTLSGAAVADNGDGTYTITI